MKKFKLEYVIAGAAVALIAIGIGAGYVVMQQQEQAAQAEKAAQAKMIKAKRAELNKLDFPQLSKTVGADEVVADLVTSEGTIKVKLFKKQAPLAVENFTTLAEEGKYDGTIFHRVLKDFMIQGGDPKGTGKGGHSIWYKKDSSKDNGNGFMNEISDQLYNLRGALAMANAGADTNGSQFFINQNHDDQAKKIDHQRYPNKIVEAYKQGGNPDLDGHYTVFGQVIEGMDVVDKIADVKVEEKGTNEKSSPVKKVMLERVTVQK